MTPLESHCAEAEAPAQPLTPADAGAALARPGLAAWLVAQPGVPDQLLSWALADREFAAGPFTVAVTAMQAKPESLTRLAERARVAGFAALREADVDRAATALEVILPKVAPAADPWAEATDRFLDPASLPWPARKFLLPRVAKSATPDRCAAWLRVEPERLSDALTLDLPTEHQTRLARSALGDDPLTEESVKTLAAHPRHAVAAVAGLAERRGLPAAGDALDALFGAAPQEPWLERLVCSAGELPPGLLAAAVELALDRGQARPAALVRAHGPDLPELLSDSAGLERLAAAYLADPPDTLVDDANALAFLGQLADKTHVTDATKSRAAAARRIHDFLREPTFEPGALTALAAALSLEPPVIPAIARGRVLRAAADGLTRQPGPAQAQLEAVLAHLGGVLAEGPVDLFRKLAADLTTRRTFWRTPELPAAVLGVALGAADDPVLAATLDGLDGDAYSLAMHARQRGGRFLRELDRRSEGWPRPARVQWQFLARAVRPRSLAREAAIFLAGAGLAIVTAALAGRLQAGG